MKKVLLGEPYALTLEVRDSNGNIVCDSVATIKIYDQLNKKYFNGVFWVDDDVDIIVYHSHDGKYSYEFTPEAIGMYSLMLLNKSYSCSIQEEIRVTEDLSEDEVINISSDKFFNQDGTDTKITDISGKPMVGVKISAYKKETKSLEAVTQSDLDGNWSLFLRPSTYIFMFEKDGYITVSFERTVE